jgi:hypothetical protein
MIVKADDIDYEDQDDDDDYDDKNRIHDHHHKNANACKSNQHVDLAIEVKYKAGVDARSLEQSSQR